LRKEIGEMREMERERRNEKKGKRKEIGEEEMRKKTAKEK